MTVPIVRAPLYSNSPDSDAVETTHTEVLDPNTVSQLELHHMHFHHGDYVQVSVAVTNGAGSESEAASDGLTVDLTPPICHVLVDGKDVNVQPKYTVSNRIYSNLLIYISIYAVM